MNKKSLWVALTAVALLSSCSQEESAPAVVQNGAKEITFSVYNTSETRGVKIANLETLKDGEIHVGAYRLQVPENTQLQTFKDTITWLAGPDGSGEWVTKHTHYWPNFDVYFYAHKPCNGLSQVEAGVQNCRVMNYVSPTASENQEDLLVAYTKKSFNDGGSVVNLAFKHALSWVSVNWHKWGDTRHDDVFYVLNKLEAVYRSTGQIALCKEDPNATPAIEQGIYWTLDNTKTNTTVLYDKTTDGALTTGEEAVLPLKRDLLIIPGNPIAIKLSYEAYQIQNDGTGESLPISEIKDVEAVLAPAGGAFVEGKHYTFNLKPTNPKGANVISFNVTIEEWDTPAGDDVNLTGNPAAGSSPSTRK